MDDDLDEDEFNGETENGFNVSILVKVILFNHLGPKRCKLQRCILQSVKNQPNLSRNVKMFHLKLMMEHNSLMSAVKTVL